MNSSESLEFELIAEILSYNVASYVDLAQMRLVSKSLPLAYLLKASGHLKVCHPSKRRYYQDLVAIGEDSYEGMRLISTRSTGQDSIEFLQLFELLPPASIQSSLYISESRDFPKSIDIEKDAATIFSTLKKLNETKSVQEFETLAKESLKKGMFFSVNEREKEKGQYDEHKEDDTIGLKDACSYAFLLTLVATKTYVEVQEEGNVRSVLFEAKNEDDVPFDFAMKMADSGSKYKGYIIKDNGREITCIVPAIIHFDEDYFYEIFNDYDAKYEHIQISSLWSKYQEQTKVEGVAIADNMISNDLHEKLTNQINNLAERSSVDYHPHSRNIVRDLIHPALFAYVKGVSPLVSRPAVPVPDFPVIEYEDIEKEEADGVTDYWGRKYEESLKYQWLPTYFSISDKGQCIIEDYINNLVPRTEHEELYTSLAQLFSQALPLFESVLSYGRSVRPRIRDFEESDGIEYDDEVPADIEEIPHSLRGEKVQVITKIVDYELNSGDTYEGVWHVEGMSHEEIVATAIYFIDRADEIEGGDLLFKRAFHREEAQYIFSSVDQTRPRPLEDAIVTGLMPLGLVQTLNKRLIVFPNSHVHKVTELKNLSDDMDVGDGVKKRRIIVFFLVNPEKRIVSTREVPPQQEIAGGKMSIDDAMTHRLELMKERKFTKQDWNVREIELCEH